jgi:hypothetical protein
MGGYGSGRHAGRATVGSGLMLDLADMIRRGVVAPGQHRSGTMSWTRTATGEPAGVIGYQACMIDPVASWLRLTYTITRLRDGSKDAHDDRVSLTTTRPPFGGLRWWFSCPVTRRRAVQLYLPDGGSLFASRRAYRLAYQSQRDADTDRSHARQARIFKKLGAEYRISGDAWPPRPKGMRHATYCRLLAELGAAESKHDEVFMAGSVRLPRRLGRLP